MIIFVFIFILPSIASCWDVSFFNQVYENDVALINYNPDIFTNLRCSGLLISPSIILTAAHCFENNPSIENDINPSDVNVYVGLTTVNDDNLQKTKQNIKKVIIHENYHFTYSEYDIAIIVLERSIENYCNRPHYTISPLLDITNIGGIFKLKSYPSYDRCFFMGWGSPNISIENNILNKKKVTNLIMRSDVVTQKALKQTMLFSNVINSNNSPCNGDSGGPIICQYVSGHLSNNYIVGIVSEASSLAPLDASPQEFCEKTDTILGSSVGLHRTWLFEKMIFLGERISC